MKAKILGIWNSAGVGTSEKTGNQFTWNNFYFCYSYTDKKESTLLGVKVKTSKISAKDLNQIMGLGIAPNELLTFNPKYFEDLGFLNADCLIEFDDESNLIDFELL